MKTLLINPYIPMGQIYGKYKKLGAVLPPLGLAYIAGHLKKNGFDAEMMDANHRKMTTSEVLPYILQNDFGLIGLYATTLGYNCAIELGSAIKKENPNVKLILGGPHAIGEKGNILEQSDVFDFVCWGEGELLMVELLQTLASGSKDYSDIGALVWRNGDEIVVNPVQDVIALDDLPSPFREFSNFNGYRQKIFSYQRPSFFNFQTSRGCPFHCIFCSSPRQLQEIQGKKMRYHSIEWIERELDFLVYEKGIREIYFVDDTFNVKKSRVVEICKLIKRKYPQLIWSCNIEVAITSKDLLIQMQDAGCWSVMIGAESGSQKILDLLKKGITVEQVRDVSNWCYEIGLMGRASFILGHPGETKETLNETIELAKTLMLPFINFVFMTPTPGTEMADIATQYGDWDDDTKNSSYVSACYVPFGLTRAYLEMQHKMAFRKVYFCLKKNLRMLTYLYKPNNRSFVYRTIPQSPHILRLLLTGNTSIQL